MNGYPTPRWNAGERQSFRDGVRLRASTIHGSRFNGPSAAEWDYDDENEES